MNATSVLAHFVQSVKESQSIWALQDKATEDWVVLDSINFENTEVMPTWSSQALAQMHCIEEWKDYIPASISIAQWMEFWVEDLLEDGIIIGVDWDGVDSCVEVELPEFTQALAEVESL